jgi:hypothetical protein
MIRTHDVVTRFARCQSRSESKCDGDGAQAGCELPYSQEPAVVTKRIHAHVFVHDTEIGIEEMKSEECDRQEADTRESDCPVLSACHLSYSKSAGAEAQCYIRGTVDPAV